MNTCKPRRQRLTACVALTLVAYATGAGAAAAVDAAVPAEVLAASRAALAQLTGAAQDTFLVVRQRRVEWPDGALGCPSPGTVYPQAPVAGYQVVLAHAGRTYDYRASARGYLMLCLGSGVGGDAPVR